MQSRRQALGALAGAALLALAPAASLAQAAEGFPSKPIKFVLPFGAGSGTDITARYFAKHLQDLSGQPVVVENRPGANGFIAVRQVLAAPADGHTVFIGSNSTLAVNAAVFRDLPYNPETDFAPLALLMRSPALLLVPGNARYQSLQDLIADARANPGKLNYGSGSAGYQLMAELFNEKAGIDTFPVPFSGGNETLLAVASNTVQLTFTEISSAQELVRSGKVRALAVAAENRRPTLPDVPTMHEAGLPEFTAYTWVAAMVSAKTPGPATERLAGWLARIASMPETREFYDKQGLESTQYGPEQTRSFQSREIALWKRVAAQAKIELK